MTFIAAVRRLPNGCGIKAPRNLFSTSGLPEGTCTTNLSSYFTPWSKRQTSFVNFGAPSPRLHSRNLSSKACPSTFSSKNAEIIFGQPPKGSHGEEEAITIDALYPSVSVGSFESIASANAPKLPLLYHSSSRLEECCSPLTPGSTPCKGDSKTQPNHETTKKRPNPFSLLELRQKFKENTPITMMTAYDSPSAAAVSRGGVDIILVGDSVGMVALGRTSTTSVTMDEMLHHCKAAVRGNQGSMVVGDLPFGSYLTAADALENAVRLIKEAGVDAVKLEGGATQAHIVRALTGAGVSVMGHVGLTPQTSFSQGGLKLQANTADTAHALKEDCLRLQEAGCFAVVLEMVPTRVAEWVSRKLSVPTIGIGAGSGTGGQVLVYHDALGMFDSFTPRFVKRYSTLGPLIESSVRQYVADVELRSFPSSKHSFKMPKEEWEAFMRAEGVDHKTTSSSDAVGDTHPLRSSQTSGVSGVGGDTVKFDKHAFVVIGSGAVGRVFTSLLSEGQDTSLVYLVSSSMDAVRTLNDEGINLRFNQAGENAGLKSENFTAVHSEQVSSPYFLQNVDKVTVVVAVKGQTATTQAAVMAREILKTREGVVVSLQNGMSHIDILHQVVGLDRFIPAVTYLGASTASDHESSDVIVGGSGDTIVLPCADYQVPYTTHFVEVVNSQSPCDGFPSITTATAELDPTNQRVLQWRKLMVNAVVNTTTAILGVRNGRVLECEESLRIVEAATKEAFEVATASGIQVFPSVDDARSHVISVLEKTSNNRSSMLSDIQRGTPVEETEIDSIIGHVTRAATAARLESPILSTLHNLVLAQSRLRDWARSDSVSDGEMTQENPSLGEWTRVVETISDYASFRRRACTSAQVVGFVPTMGNLHEGHLDLVRAAKEECDVVVVSVFVNPTQFAPGEDLDAYPRTFQSDLTKLEALGVDCVFVPSEGEMYANGRDGQQSMVVMDNITQTEESKSRPHFFSGVATVCAKLFNIVQPDKVYFGQKDAIQCLVIQQLVRDLSMPIEVTIVPTAREENGLAMSSRNNYLSEAQRSAAGVIYSSLLALRRGHENGVGSVHELVAAGKRVLQTEPLIDEILYVSVADASTGVNIEDGAHLDGSEELLISVAVKMGSTRLIDNIVIRGSAASSQRAAASSEQ